MTQVIKLNKWQSIVARDTHRFIRLNAGRRSGKSFFSALKIIFFAARNADSVIYYVSPSYKQSKAIMWEMIKKHSPKGFIKSANETTQSIIFANNARLEVKGADAEPDALRGIRIDFLVCDEVASFRNWDTVWNQVLRPTLVDSKGKGMFLSTPKGHNFWFDFYMKEDPEFASYTFSSYENDYLDPTEIEKTKAEMSEDDFRQEFMADFVTVEGQVYKEWNLNTNFVPVAYDPKLELHVSFDFGVNDPTAIIWIQRNGGEFRIIDHYEVSNANVDHFVQVIRSKPYRWPSLFTGDSAGKARSIVTNTSPIEEYAKHDIFIRTTDGLQIPEQIRITHKYIKSLYVDSKLTRMRDVLLNYHYPKKKENTLNQSNEIPVHDEFSHTARALEYYFANIDTATFSNKTHRFYERNKYNIA